ncbi:unnamed protein product [Brugia timori]|uniref:Uncharacterized protein n=1 Tax=Brugia timori TaxID=42155 RepID=A0A0R3QD20_9BILA|nr:unnamed protein product [Brugia timori]
MDYIRHMTVCANRCHSETFVVNYNKRYLLSSNPQENHLLHPLSNYASRKIGRQEPSSFHHQQQQRIGHRPSFMRRLSAAIPSLSTDSMPFAAVSSLLP